MAELSWEEGPRAPQLTCPGSRKEAENLANLPVSAHFGCRNHESLMGDCSPGATTTEALAAEPPLLLSRVTSNQAKA